MLCADKVSSNTQSEVCFEGIEVPIAVHSTRVMEVPITVEALQGPCQNQVSNSEGFTAKEQV